MLGFAHLEVYNVFAKLILTTQKHHFYHVLFNLQNTQNLPPNMFVYEVKLRFLKIRQHEYSYVIS